MKGCGVGVGLQECKERVSVLVDAAVSADERIYVREERKEYG